jgi:DNA-binding response OmpR family regulator
MTSRSADDGQLAQCAAIVIAHDDREAASLIALAHKVGFGWVTQHNKPLDPQIVQDRVVYFLVHFAISLTAKKQLLAGLRGSKAANMSFAPVMVFLRDGPFEDVIDHIELGFDDVISLPENAQILTARLAAQLDQEHFYVESGDYLGPDRRRLDKPAISNFGRSGTSDHARITIVRKPGSGVHVVRRQLFAKVK